MQLKEIDKQRYRRHLNIVIAVSILLLAAGSLGIAQALIAIFPDDSGSHFHWNLSGVVVSALFIGFILNKIRKHPFMTEVVYVWELKQSLNKINRKMLKLQTAAKEGNYEALLALNFSCAGSRLLWQLDDNTILMDDLAIEQAKVDSLAKQFDLKLLVDNYAESILEKF